MILYAKVQKIKIEIPFLSGIKHEIKSANTRLDAHILLRVNITANTCINSYDKRKHPSYYGNRTVMDFEGYTLTLYFLSKYKQTFSH